MDTGIMIHEILPLIPIVFVIITFIVTWLITNVINYHTWKRNIKYFLPEVARDEINERDDRISELEKNNTALAKELQENKKILNS